MAFTKVVGPGIHTLSNILSHNINSSGIITATKFVGPFDNATIGGGTTITSDGINVTGIVTATGLDINGNGDISGNLVLGGDLTVNGTTTTLDTNLIGVDRVEVGAAGAVVGLAITQSGSADLVRLYDGSTQVVTVDDEGNVGIASAIPSQKLDVIGTVKATDINVGENIAHIDDTDTKIVFTNNNIDLQTGGSSRISASGFGLFVQSGLQLGFLASSGPSPSIRSGGTNNQDLALTSGVGNPTRLTIKADGKIGIGTENPGQNLEIYGTGTTTQVEVNGTGRYRGFEIHEGGTRKAYFHHDSTDNIAMLNTAEANLQFYTGDTYRMKLDGNGDLTFKDSAAQGNSLQSMIRVTDSSSNIQYEIGMLSTGNEDLYFSNSRNSNIRFRTQATTRWKIDGDPGHLLPETAGAVDIGSASKEIGNVYLADSKNIYIGSDQDVYFNHSGVHAQIKNTTGNFYFDTELAHYIRLGSSNEAAITATHNGSVDLYYDGGTYTTPKLKTSTTGITVDGEVATSQEYPNFQPTFDANFAASRTLDPRFTFQRVGPTSFVNESGKVVLVDENVPRFDHNPTTRESLGILIEEARTNSWTYSQPTSSAVFGANGTVTYEAATAPNGKTEAFRLANNPAGSSNSYHRATRAITFGSDAMVLSVWAKGENNNNYFIWSFQNLGGAIVRAGFKLEGDGETSIITNGNGGHTLQIQKYPDGWYRCIIIANTQSSGSTTQFLYTASGYSESSSATGGSTLLWGFQLEVGSFATSYIPTSSAAVTRGADLLRIMDDEFKDIFGDEFKEFTIVADYDNSDTVDGTIQALVDFWGESTGYTDRIEIFKDGDSPYNIEVRGIANNAGLFANGVANASSKAATQRFATSWSVDYTTTNAANRRWAFSFSGEAVDVIGDAVGTDIPALTRLGLGNTPTRLDLSPGKLHFKRFTFYPKAVSDQQLINLSTP